MIQLLMQKIMQDTLERFSEGTEKMYLVKVRNNMSTQSHKKVTNTKEDHERMKEIKEVSVNGKKM